MLAAERGQRVKARAAIVVRGPPCAFDPVALLQSLERRVQGPVVDEECVSGPRLDRERDAVAMMRSKCEHTEDEEIQRSLEERISRRVVSSGHSTGVLRPSSRMSTRRNYHRCETAHSGCNPPVLAMEYAKR